LSGGQTGTRLTERGIVLRQSGLTDNPEALGQSAVHRP
jgi:hypothetical protein